MLTKTEVVIFGILLSFFIPLVGCLIYLFTQVINKSDVSNITEEITTIIHPTKKIKDLEKELVFSNTFQNRINLADAYAANNEYKKAIELYEKSLTGIFKNDPHTINKLVKCYFKINDFEQVILHAKKIDLNKEFRESLYFFALALEKNENLEEAEKQFRKVDERFSNYNERVELANFLIRRNKKEDAKEILKEVQLEINSMTSSKKSKYRFIYQESEKVLNQL